MTETPQVPVPASPAVPAEAGFFTRLAEHAIPHAEAGIQHAEGDAEALAARLRADYLAHASGVFSLASDLTRAAQAADPADAGLSSELVPRVLAIAESAARIAGAALRAA